MEFGRFQVNQHTWKYEKVSATPIKYAAAMGKVEAVKYMLKGQRDISMQELFFSAANGGSVQMVKWMIEAELVDPNVRSELGANVLILAAKYYDLTEYLLDRKLVDSNNIFDCANLGHVAALHGNIKLIKRYLDQGGDIEARDGKGRTLLLVALNQSELESVKFLVENGANIDVDNVKCHSLPCAIAEDDEEFVKALNLEANCSMIRPPEFVLIADSFLQPNYIHVQKRFINYFLPILPKNLIEEVTESIFNLAISFNEIEFLEAPFKLAMSQDTSREFKEALIANPIYLASSNESLTILKEVLRLSDDAAILSAETVKTLFKDGLSKSIQLHKADFVEFWMKEKGITLEECSKFNLRHAWKIDYLASVGFEFSATEKEEAHKYY